MKRKGLLILLLFFISICCKQNDKNTTLNANPKEDYVVQDTDNKNCILKSDSTEVKAFAKEIIVKMIAKDYEDLFNKMENPIQEKEAMAKMSKDLPDYIEAVFSIDIDNEEGETVGEIRDIENAKIVYEKDQENCFIAFIGLDTVLYFTVKKLQGKLKIVKYDIAG